MILNKSKRRFLVCACISILASAKTSGASSSDEQSGSVLGTLKPISQMLSESEEVIKIEEMSPEDKRKDVKQENNISSIPSDMLNGNSETGEYKDNDDQINIIEELNENSEGGDIERKKDISSMDLQTNEKSGDQFKNKDEHKNNHITNEDEIKIELNSEDEDSKEAEVTEERDKEEMLKKLCENIQTYGSHNWDLQEIAHEIIAEKGGYKNMTECLFGDKNKDNIAGIKEYMENDDLFRYIMLQIERIRAKYKDKDYEKGGGWAAIGANPDFYDSEKQGGKVDINEYYNTEVRSPKNDNEKDFTNTFRTIGLYIRNYIYYISYVKLFKNGDELALEDAIWMKHYVQRIIDDNDTYESAYTKKYLFAKIGEIINNEVFVLDILNPKDIEQLNALAKKKEKSGNDLNELKRKIEKDVDDSYLKIIDINNIISYGFAEECYMHWIDYCLTKNNVRSSAANDTPITKLPNEEPDSDRVQVVNDFEYCLNSVKDCLKLNNNIQSDTDVFSAIKNRKTMLDFDLSDNFAKVDTLARKITTLHNLMNERNLLYINDPEIDIALDDCANPLGHTNIPVLKIEPKGKLSVPALIKDILDNKDNLRDLYIKFYETTEDDVYENIKEVILNSKGILTTFDHEKVKTGPKFVYCVKDDVKQKNSGANDDLFIKNPKSIIREKLMMAIKKAHSISGRQCVVLAKLFAALGDVLAKDLEIVVWDGVNKSTPFDNNLKLKFFNEKIIDDDSDYIDDDYSVVYPKHIKTIQQLKELKNLGKIIGEETLMEIVECSGQSATSSNSSLDSDDIVDVGNLEPIIMLMLNLQNVDEDDLPTKDPDYFYNTYNEYFAGAEEKGLKKLFRKNDGICSGVLPGYILDGEQGKIVLRKPNVSNKTLLEKVIDLFESNRKNRQRISELESEVSGLNTPLEDIEIGKEENYEI